MKAMTDRWAPPSASVGMRRHCLRHSHTNDPDYEFDDLGEEWE